jgi:sulfur carrier protein ThiS
MKINLSITGPVKKPGGQSEIDIYIDGKKKIKDILLEHGYKEEELEFIMCFLNNKPVAMDTEVKDKDKICLTLLVGGG